MGCRGMETKMDDHRGRRTQQTNSRPAMTESREMDETHALLRGVEDDGVSIASRPLQQSQK